MAQGTEHQLANQTVPVQFPVKARAWVAGLVPSEGRVCGRQPHIDVSLLLFLPSPLKRNKIFFFFLRETSLKWRGQKGALLHSTTHINYKLIVN